ncbi:MAG: helix-turn-helix domain-containing protein [candidate division WOR-3 bacterium]
MPRRHKLDKNYEAKRKAIKLYEEGLTLEEIAQRISIEFPIQVSKSSIHRLIQRYKDLLKLKEAGIFSDEDVDLFLHSQNLAQLSAGMTYEILAEWQEKGQIDSEKLKAILSLLKTTSDVAKSNAYIEKTKMQISRQYERLLEKIIFAINKVIKDEEERNALIESIKNELQN